MDINRAVDLLIEGVGTFMHLHQLSFLGANDPTAMALVPNAASTLLTVILLAALTNWRPIRGPARRYICFNEFVLRSLLELTVIVCCVELLLLWLWIPLLVVLSGAWEWVTEDYNLEPKLADWINDGFFVLRFMLAVSLAFIIVLFHAWLRTDKTSKHGTFSGHQKIEAGQRAGGPTRRCGQRNGQVYDRPITVRPGGGFTRNRNRRFAIHGVTLDESSA